MHCSANSQKRFSCQLQIVCPKDYATTMQLTNHKMRDTRLHKKSGVTRQQKKNGFYIPVGGDIGLGAMAVLAGRTGAAGGTLLF